MISIKNNFFLGRCRVRPVIKLIEFEKFDRMNNRAFFREL